MTDNSDPSKTWLYHQLCNVDHDFSQTPRIHNITTFDLISTLYAQFFFRVLSTLLKNNENPNQLASNKAS